MIISERARGWWYGVVVLVIAGFALSASSCRSEDEQLRRLACQIAQELEAHAGWPGISGVDMDEPIWHLMRPEQHPYVADLINIGINIGLPALSCVLDLHLSDHEDVRFQAAYALDQIFFRMHGYDGGYSHTSSIDPDAAAIKLFDQLGPIDPYAPRAVREPVVERWRQWLRTASE